MKVLLTGGSGFLGRHAVDALSRSDAEIVATYRRQPGPQRPGIEWRVCDLLNGDSVAALVRETRPTHLLHMAWRPVYGDVADARDNVHWLKASLDLATEFIDAGGQRIVGAGTCLEYGASFNPCDEALTRLAPANTYASCKHALRAALDGLTRAAGVELAWARIFFAYGPGEHETRFVASVARSLLRGEPAEMTSGQQVRDYTYASDLGEALSLLVQSDHVGEFNIGSGTNAALRDIALELARQIGRPELLRLGAKPNRPHEAPMIVADLDKTAAALGWRPRTSLPAGLAETIETLRAAG